ncbi:TonB-dependent siderophore receptor [Thauera sp. Sel9]|uniref:TonB-dependent siderophore receptor n=1 Tax=Thauera sp. Sel9 TaxID=2974299 RepID=UPI0021E16F3B|nr:TonB-dependent siderophore receptor [Thauera sp. Sel9]MCV2216319.1 TonB-dependent siderophore receptor [Thauera sp. Sel9]
MHRLHHGRLPARLSLIALCLGLAAPASAQTGSPLASPLPLSISAQPLDKALTELATKTGLLIGVDSSLLAGKQAPAINGRYTPTTALDKLLEGSGLEAVSQGGNEYTLRKLPVRSGETRLAPVTVSAGVLRDATSEGTGAYAARGATLFKGAQSLKEIPQSVTVITRQRMDDQGLDTLTEVLEQTPGITLRKRPNGGSDIYARGFLTETLQYDGIPLSRYHNWGNSLTASSVHLDRVEVLRGAQGLLEGAGSPAGAVNLVRKRGLAERALTVEGRVGSWDHYGTRLDVGGPLNQEGTLRGRAVLDYEDKQSFLDTVWDRNLNLYAALDFDATPDTTIGVGVAHARLKGNSALYPGVPRYADGRDLGLPRSAYVAAGWNEADRRETQVFLDLEHRFSENWKLKAAAAYVRENYDAVESHANGRVAVGGSTVNGVGYAYDDAANSRGLDIHLSGKLQALGLAHEVVIGGNYTKQKRDDGYVQYWNYTTYDVFNPDHDTPHLSAYTPSDIWEQQADTTQKGLYALLRSHLTERATLVLGGRASWYEFNDMGISRVDGYTFSSAKKESGEFTPYGGLVYALTPQWSAYASYAEIFNPQSATDAQRRLLEPMTGTHYEVGVKGELFGGALNTSLAVYRAEQKNRAVTDYDSPMLCDGWYCSRAAGKVRSEGVEIEAHGELAPGWQLSGGYTYGRNEYLDDVDPARVGKPFDYISPKHMLRLWSNYRLPGELHPWQVGLGTTYRSQQKTSSSTMLNPVQGGYAIWNARVAYQIDKTWSAALNIDNLFDKKYYASIDDQYYYNHVGEPRRFLLTVRGSF